MGHCILGALDILISVYRVHSNGNGIQGLLVANLSSAEVPTVLIHLGEN